MAHKGSSFDDFLESEGIAEEVEVAAIKKVVAGLIQEAMEQQHIRKTTMARMIGTSRSQLERLLDQENHSVTLVTLVKAASALNKRLVIKLEDKEAIVA